MKQCRVRWEGPLTLDAVLQMQDIADVGLYQIYGSHPVFGAESLLYIGRTEKPFSERFQRHCDEWLLLKGTPWYQAESDVSVRIGRLWLNPVPYREASEILRDVEAFEIFCHHPPGNSSNISSYNGQPLLVQNEGERGGLLACISTSEISHDGLAES